MKILVTGGAGFIGSNLALNLEKLGNNVTVLDNFIKGNMYNLEGFKGRLLEGDETELFSIDSIFDIVFHMAAITDTTITNKREMYRNNVEGFQHVLNYYKRSNCKLIFASSAAIYGDGDVPMREDQKLKPLNIYAESKLEMENMARKYFNGGTLVGLRYFNVFGPKENFKGKMASMIYQLARQMKAGKNPRIFKYGEQERDHIYVKDVVNATIKAASYKGFGIFNVATGIKTSFNQLIHFLNGVLGTDYKPKYFDNPYVDSYQNVTVSDMRKIESELKFASECSVLEGIKDYMKWLDDINWYEK